MVPISALNDLPRLLETANIEGRKEFVRAFIGGITVRPDTGVLDLQMKPTRKTGAPRIGAPERRQENCGD